MSALSPHIDLLGYGERVTDLDSEIADRDPNLSYGQQELAEISHFRIDQRCLGPAERMSAVERPIIASQPANGLAYCRVLRCFADSVQGRGMS